jgi:hypothetical protein
MKEKSELKLKPDSKDTKSTETSSVEDLLIRAAQSIGKGNRDIAKYVAKLDSDWYSDRSEIAGMSV